MPNLVIPAARRAPAALALAAALCAARPAAAQPAAAAAHRLPATIEARSVSDARKKAAFRDVDGEWLLGRLAATPVRTWQYTAQAPAIRHMGPTAQDFRRAFALGESDTTITSVDADGVALAAAQALERRTRALQAENAALRAELAASREATAALRRDVTALWSEVAAMGRGRVPARARSAARVTPAAPARHTQN